MPRTSACSEVRNWSSWTELEVCWIGITPLSGSSGALGLPGFRSTKRLPSRKSLGRSCRVASSWIGLPWSLIVIVISAALEPETGSTAVTSPTLTPAILTGLFLAMLWASLITAVSS